MMHTSVESSGLSRRVRRLIEYSWSMRHLSTMRKLLLAVAFAAASLAPRPAAAQATVQLRFDLPVVLPRMVVIEPGIQVVPMVNEEVFYVDGYYWVRRDGRWYRSHDHRRGWVYVDHRGVPPRLDRIPGGHYRHWNEEKGHHDREVREREQQRREQAREREKRDREQVRERDRGDKGERRDRKDDRKDDRRDDRREDRKRD
jgi:hypothetical protein